MLRVRFAPSPTGYLHIGSARTFIFNWLYARHNQGVMILRIDDTDVERNTQTSLDSIFDGLGWLDLSWDEFYRQSERLDLHRKLANDILAKGLAYRDFTPLAVDTEEKGHSEGHWLFHPEMRAMSREESDRRANAGESFVVRYRVPRESRDAVTFEDLVYGEQSKATADIEDFALLRSNSLPTYHHPRPGSPNEYLQTRIDLRGAGSEAAGVCASSLVDCARWIQAVETQARPGGQRDHLS
jgi:glutamyl-tRNA synthetase